MRKILGITMGDPAGVGPEITVKALQDPKVYEYPHYPGTAQYSVLLAHTEVRVVHVSTAVSLREACDRVKKDRVLEVISIADKACRDMGIAKPRIGVAGLNPHCGEGGIF